jgi:sugar-specific transcriptional regulator TrmB
MSKEIDLNIAKELADFGLNDKEALIYMELLRGGEASAIALSKATELHRQFVYNALSALKERGLVLQIGEKRARWRAQSPRKFIALAEEQELRATKLSESLFSLMQQKGGQEFEVTEGNAAFRVRSVDSVRKAPHGSTILMITGQWEKYFQQAGLQMHAEWDKVRLAKEIKFRMIGPRSMRPAMSREASERALTEYRIFPGLEENLVNTVIFDNHIDFEIYGDPHLTFSIKNPEVTESQKRFFNALWDKSEEL